MSREIKFRGKRKDNGGTVYGSLSMGGGCPPHYDKTRTFIEPNEPVLRRIEVHPGTVGEFAGLHDKNGVEIYEGDKTTMLENFDDEGVYAECGTIVWDVKRCCFLWDYQNKHNEFWTLDEMGPIEVIGNIHETPADGRTN